MVGLFGSISQIALNNEFFWDIFKLSSSVFYPIKNLKKNLPKYLLRKIEKKVLRSKPKTFHL
tara:strand:- start:28 stop:213 length:186 start_codon:yes stop_codon:yes gene_type:complete